MADREDEGADGMALGSVRSETLPHSPVKNFTEHVQRKVKVNLLRKDLPKPTLPRGERLEYRNDRTGREGDVEG